MKNSSNDRKSSRVMALSELKRALNSAKPYKDKNTGEVIWALDAWIIYGLPFIVLGQEIDPSTDMVCVKGKSDPDPESGFWIRSKKGFEETYACITSNLFFYHTSASARALI